MSQKSMSIAKSAGSYKSKFDIKQTKSVDEFDEYPLKNRAEWYEEKCSHINMVPSSVPVLKNS